MWFIPDTLDLIDLTLPRTLSVLSTVFRVIDNLAVISWNSSELN